MPLNRYFKGHGRSVMRKMEKRYGKTSGKRIFYATVNSWRKSGSKSQKKAQPKRGPGQRRTSKRRKG